MQSANAHISPSLQASQEAVYSRLSRSTTIRIPKRSGRMLPVSSFEPCEPFLIQPPDTLIHTAPHLDCSMICHLMYCSWWQTTFCLRSEQMPAGNTILWQHKTSRRCIRKNARAHCHNRLEFCGKPSLHKNLGNMRHFVVRQNDAVEGAACLSTTVQQAILHFVVFVVVQTILTKYSWTWKVDGFDPLHIDPSTETGTW